VGSAAVDAGREDEIQRTRVGSFHSRPYSWAVQQGSSHADQLCAGVFAMITGAVLLLLPAYEQPRGGCCLYICEGCTALDARPHPTAMDTPGSKEEQQL
jgi:hypothetical protein